MDVFFERSLYEFLANYKEPSYEYVSSFSIVPNSSFIDSRIREYIRSRCHHVVRADRLTIYSPRKLPMYKTRFMVLYHAFLHFALTKIKPAKQPIHTYLYLTPFQKRFPKAPPLMPFHINSGFTTGDHTEIHIYREEEVFKVLLHELIHAFDIDDQEINRHQHRFQTALGLRHPLILNEAFTDTMACMYNVVIHRSIAKLIHHPTKTLQHERRFIMQRAANIRQFLGDELRNDTHNTVSYYILKAANVFDLPKFEQLLRAQNWHIQDREVYIQHLTSNVENEHFWKHLDNNRTNCRSLRMSSVDVADLLKVHKSKLLKTLMSLSIH